MDHLRAWKMYVRAMEEALGRAGYLDSAEFSVHRTDTSGAAGARWSWIRQCPHLTSEEWPDGLDLAWDSAAGWGFRARNADQLVPLPVPVLAAPHAIVALLPALMDGRRGQLPASEDQWEHATTVVDLVNTASLHDDDKYGPDYQRHEEEAAHFLHWEDQLDGALPNDLARATDEERTAGEGHCGGGSSEPGTEELARRRHITTILDAALKARSGPARHPDPELFGILTDYFTRAVAFPGQLDPDDGQLHTSDPARALAHLLLQHLERHGLDLENVPELEVPESSVAPVGDAMAECVAQALRASRWFASAAAGSGSEETRVRFRTVFGTDGVLRLADTPGPIDSATA